MTVTTWEAVAFDIEANGFTPTEMFCIGITDLITLEHEIFGPDDLITALVRLAEAKIVVGHSIRSYDCKVITRLTGGEVTFRPEAIIDTLDISKALGEHHKHSMEHWGDVFGIPKLTATLQTPLFEKYEPNMLPYCSRDVQISVRLFFHGLERYLQSGLTFRNSQGLDRFVELLRR